MNHSKLDFKTKLVPTGPEGAWYFLHFPFDVVKTFGTRARVPVTGAKQAETVQRRLKQLVPMLLAKKGAKIA